MKKIAILIGIFLCCSIVAKAQLDSFEKLTDMKGVTTVYISKAMLGMISDVDGSKMSMDGVDIGDVVKKLTSITVLTSENADVAKAFKKVFAEVKSNKAFEPLMLTKSDESRTAIYAKEGNAKNNEESEILVTIENDKDNRHVLVRLTGSMTLTDIQKIATEKK